MSCTLVVTTHWPDLFLKCSALKAVLSFHVAMVLVTNPQSLRLHCSWTLQWPNFCYQGILSHFAITDNVIKASLGVTIELTIFQSIRPWYHWSPLSITVFLTIYRSSFSDFTPAWFHRALPNVVAVAMILGLVSLLAEIMTSGARLAFWQWQKWLLVNLR